MANPLIAQYRELANSLDPLIQQLAAENRPIAAQQVGAAQGTLRAACINMITNDIDVLLDPAQPQAASAITALTNATNALQAGAAAIAADENKVTTIVGVATAAMQIASSLVPLNLAEIGAAANDTIKLLSS
jgi:hypothetical protein